MVVSSLCVFWKLQILKTNVAGNVVLRAAFVLALDVNVEGGSARDAYVKLHARQFSVTIRAPECLHVLLDCVCSVGLSCIGASRVTFFHWAPPSEVNGDQQVTGGI